MPISITVGFSISLWVSNVVLNTDINAVQEQSQKNPHCLIVFSHGMKFLMAPCSNIFSSMSFKVLHY